MEKTRNVRNTKSGRFEHDTKGEKIEKEKERGDTGIFSFVRMRESELGREKKP